MRQYLAFVKKELLEGMRTYKLFVVLAIFALFGIMSPLFAKLTPEIISLAMPEGMQIPVPTPAALDSWAQFYKNNTQLGLVAVTLIFGGILNGEITKGTLINMLTKGLSKTSVILSKFTYMATVWSVGLLLSFAITWGYTVSLFPTDGSTNLLFSVFCLWLFGLFLFAFLLLSSALSKNSYSSLLLVGLLIVLCTALNLIPRVGDYNPMTLIVKNMDLVAGNLSPSALLGNMAVTLVLTVLSLLGALWVFKKRQL